jgi:hypothetical protein
VGQRLPGNATYPAASGGAVVFTTDREAASQRDATQQVFLQRPGLARRR